VPRVGWECPDFDTPRGDDGSQLLRPIVQALGGWKTERMMKRYAAVTDATQRAAAGKSEISNIAN
jgi:hypothetical protein